MQSGVVSYHPALDALLTPVDQIRQHQKNPKNGDIDAIAESITVNGCFRPIYAQRSSGTILAGHHLYQALLSLGAADVPGAVAGRR